MLKYKKIQILIILITLTVISIIAVLAVYANYTGVIGQASDIGYIARWNITMNSAEEFFKHNYELNLYNKNRNGEYVIAPGVSGNAEIILNNDGDVKANVKKIILRKSNDQITIPLRFSIDKTNWKTLEGEEVTIDISNCKINVGENKKVTTIYWEWPLEGNDIVDTVVGVMSAKGNNSFKLDVSIFAEQLIEE